MKLKMTFETWKSMCCLRWCCFDFRQSGFPKFNMSTKQSQCSLCAGRQNYLDFSFLFEAESSSQVFSIDSKVYPNQAFLVTKLSFPDSYDKCAPSRTVQQMLPSVPNRSP